MSEHIPVPSEREWTDEEREEFYANQEPECECVRIDVDLDDARNCPMHGPDSELARRQKWQEAQDIWDFYNPNPGRDNGCAELRRTGITDETVA